MGKTFEEFLEFRNKQLTKLAGGSAKGFHIFDNTLAKTIFEAKPTNLTQLGKIKGFPSGGERHKKYGKAIVEWFMTSSLFK